MNQNPLTVGRLFFLGLLATIGWVVAIAVVQLVVFMAWLNHFGINPNFGTNRLMWAVVAIGDVWSVIHGVFLFGMFCAYLPWRFSKLRERNAVFDRKKVVLFCTVVAAATEAFLLFDLRLTVLLMTLSMFPPFPLATFIFARRFTGRANRYLRLQQAMVGSGSEIASGDSGQTDAENMR